MGIKWKYSGVALLLTSIVMTLHSCKPDEPEPIPDCVECGPFMLDEVGEFLYFKPGSWWVYKETFSGKLDTLRMKSSSKRMRKIVGEKRTITYEHLSFIQISQTNGARYTYDQFAPFPDGKDPFKFHYAFDKSRSDPYVGHTQAFGWPADENLVVGGNGFGMTYLKEQVDSIIIQGKIYYDVYHFEITRDGSFVHGKDHWDNGGPTEYLWAKGVGLIKNGSLRYDKNWELVDYHVE